MVNSVGLSLDYPRAMLTFTFTRLRTSDQKSLAHAPCAGRAGGGGARRRHAIDASIIAFQGGRRTVENGKEEKEGLRLSFGGYCRGGGRGGGGGGGAGDHTYVPRRRKRMRAARGYRGNGGDRSKIAETAARRPCRASDRRAACDSKCNCRPARSGVELQHVYRGASAAAWFYCRLS
jgi:hypothetical protein